MLRIRRIYDDVHEADRRAIEQAQQILRSRLPVSERTVNALPSELRDPFLTGLRSILFVAQDGRGGVRGFALLRHAPDLHFSFLDFISVSRREGGRGVGGALYERVREEAVGLGADGLFLECMPDEPDQLRDASTVGENRARLRFYERYGARPIVGTAYATPLRPGEEAPLLIYDPLGTERPLSRRRARQVVRTILERRYGDVCSPDYIRDVVASFKDDPVRIREPRYARRGEIRSAPVGQRLIPLVVNERHRIHHVRERGYVEAPVRVPAILGEIERTGMFRRLEAKHFPDRLLADVHDPDFVAYLKRVCANIGPRRSVYPYVFPIRNVARPPKDLELRAGYYCIDTFTPLNGNAYLAARAAVDCALTAAETLLEGERGAYALVRPPGHHAERRSFGGFCYFNSTAVAAAMLAAHGTVAILDVDYHHGNGQQDIFWRRGDVLTVSIHGHPRFAYPYFSGFEEERGEDSGHGRNVNIPLAEEVDGPRYRAALRKALDEIRRFGPRFLVVALGLDPARGDPTGTWSLTAADFEGNGRMIREVALPTLVVQEGGYRTRSIGVNARRFFTGLWGAPEARPAR